MANLIVCCDGTWNTEDERTNGVPCPTNVVKIRDIAADAGADGALQRKYYHSGVGTEGGLVEKIKGGALGDGLEKNIKSAYKWLGETYAPGDKIFIFGFSRGAYTARYAAGMICSYGLVDLVTTGLAEDAKWRRVDAVYLACSKEAKLQPSADIQFFNTPAGQPGKETTPVHFLGVWDTVGALGIPGDLALLSLIEGLSSHEFQDTELSKYVLHARHAVAMDEKRQSFTPTFWTKVEDHPDVKQIWFPGVHSDVGGGYVETGLSDSACEWMALEAQACGLTLRKEGLEQLAPDARGVLHNSCVGVFAALKTLPRSVPRMAVSGGAAELLHASARGRHVNPPVGQGAFWATKVLAPGEAETLDVFAREHWNRTGLYLEKGVQYEFKAEGEWLDGSIKCGPGGAGSAAPSFGRLVQKAASAWGEAEKRYKQFTGNEEADFWWSKRVEDCEWFTLMGVVANGAGTSELGSPVPHETFAIGTGTPYTPAESGYLWCFANDAWLAYANNRGSVRLTVSRA